MTSPTHDNPIHLLKHIFSPTQSTPIKRNIMRIIKLAHARILLSMLLPLAGLAAGKVEYREVEATGSGSTVVLATQAALTECIARAYGVTVATETRLDVVEASLSENDSEKSTAFQKLQQRIATATKGRIASYEVVSVDRNARAGGAGGTGVEIKIVAKIPHYNDPQANRLRLAFIPFKASQKFFESDDKKLAGADIAAQFAQALAQNIVSTRKFAVLDREYVNAVSGEHQRIAASASGDDLGKLGAILGADYIVCGSVEDLHTGIESTEHPYVKGHFIKRRHGGISVAIRIIDVATGQIKLMDTINAKDSISANVQSASVEVCRWVADSCALKITETIYPMLVIALEDGAAILNQGGDMIRVGDKYELFTLGKEMRDPRTGESLGRRERTCGLIQITLSNLKMSEARVLEGAREVQTALDTKQQVICRPLK